MKRRSSEDSWDALNIVTDAAERYLNRSPRFKRLEAERQALLDAIRRAQLMLSVKRLPVMSTVEDGFSLLEPGLLAGETGRSRQATFAVGAVRHLDCAYVAAHLSSRCPLRMTAVAERQCKPEPAE